MLKWRNKTQQQEATQQPVNIIDAILTNIKKQVQDGNINEIQLTKINNLIANTERLKNVLTLL